MSFYKQPLTYQCGPFALKYALVMLGRMEDEKEIEEIAGSSWWSGTDELGLERAANYYDCDFIEILENEPDAALDKLNKSLKQNTPAVLCVDRWSHWIAVIRHEDNRYVCVDSGMKKVIITIPQRELLRRWRFLDKKISTYAGYIVSPRYRVSTRAKFTLERAKLLMSPKYEDLALHWNGYYNVLLEIARPKNPVAEYTITMREFLRRYQKSIVELVAEWHGDIAYKELDHIMDNLLFIANTYNMVIHTDDINTAVINLSIVLTMYATHNYGTLTYL